MGAPQVIFDHSGHKLGVFLDMKQYHDYLKVLEEYEDIKAFDKRMKNPKWTDWSDIKDKYYVQD